PSPMTTTPSIGIMPSALRMASTAAPSAVFLSPRPIQRALASAPASVTRTSSRARLRLISAETFSVARSGRAIRYACDVPASAPAPNFSGRPTGGENGGNDQPAAGQTSVLAAGPNRARCPGHFADLHHLPVDGRLLTTDGDRPVSRQSHQGGRHLRFQPQQRPARRGDVAGAAQSLALPGVFRGRGRLVLQAEVRGDADRAVDHPVPH